MHRINTLYFQASCLQLWRFPPPVQPRPGPQSMFFWIDLFSLIGWKTTCPDLTFSLTRPRVGIVLWFASSLLQKRWLTTNVEWSCYSCTVVTLNGGQLKACVQVVVPGSVVVEEKEEEEKKQVDQPEISYSDTVKNRANGEMTGLYKKISFTVTTTMSMICCFNLHLSSQQTRSVSMRCQLHRSHLQKRQIYHHCMNKSPLHF